MLIPFLVMFDFFYALHISVLLKVGDGLKICMRLIKDSWKIFKDAFAITLGTYVTFDMTIF